MTDAVRVYRNSGASFSDYGEGPGNASIARLVGPDTSTTMGAYFARFDRRSIPWTVHYDEMIVCLSGCFRLVTAMATHELGAGDAIWISQGTELRYEGENAEVFIAIAPVDWRQRSEG